MSNFVLYFYISNGIQTSKNDVYKIPKNKIVSNENGVVTFIKEGQEFKAEIELLREYYLPSKSDGENKSYQNLKSYMKKR